MREYYVYAVTSAAGRIEAVVASSGDEASSQVSDGVVAVERRSRWPLMTADDARAEWPRMQTTRDGCRAFRAWLLDAARLGLVAWASVGRWVEQVEAAERRIVARESRAKDKAARRQPCGVAGRSGQGRIAKTCGGEVVRAPPKNRATKYGERWQSRGRDREGQPKKKTLPRLPCIALFVVHPEVVAVNAREIAKRIVEQWDKYDKFRAIPEEGEEEPSGVTVARALLRVDAEYGCEVRDPSGTIWQHAARVEQERDKYKAAMEQMRVLLLGVLDESAPCSSHCSSSDRTLILALRALARDIQCDDGVANAAILEAAQRLDALSNAIQDIRDSVLHERHQLAEAGLDCDQVNAVLGIIDDNDPRVLD